MIKKIDTRNMSREEWLNARSKYIGGSDAGAIAGLNPWKSQLQVYLEKTNQTDLAIKDNERMRIGRDLEDYVAQRFSEATGKKVRKNNFMLIDGFMSANVDREVVGENAVLECKTTNSYAKSDWEDDKIPFHYELQCHHYMMVGGYEKAYIAVLIGNEKFVYKEIPRDEETIEMLRNIETAFWNDYVLKNELPRPDGTESYSQELKSKFRGGLTDSIEISIDKEKFSRLNELKELKNDVETKIKRIEQDIQIEMKDHEHAFTNGYEITWKTQTRTSLDTKKLKEEHPEILDKYSKSNEYRVFRIKELKN